uniref:Putative secreted protein n=1 Tax=Panstrongylus lignarius TaxID=156445 RepID=A0A224Y5Y1_9HEMI
MVTSLFFSSLFVVFDVRATTSPALLHTPIKSSIVFGSLSCMTLRFTKLNCNVGIDRSSSKQGTTLVSFVKVIS